MHQEVAFLALHCHWSLQEILDLEHRDRRRWVQEVAQLRGRGSGEG
ncbi:DUF6760 family protein [Synechococcus sp. PCC 7336]